MLVKLLLAATITFLPTYALADFITFDNFNQSPLAGSHTEGAFTYQVPAGSTSYSVSTAIGNPVGGLITGGIFGQVITGQVLDIFLTGGGGGLFTFTSYENSSNCGIFECHNFSPPPPGNPNVQSVDILGIRGGVTQYSILDVFTTGSTFITQSSGANAGTPIDTLRLRINRAGTGRQLLDNINLTILSQSRVAEPSTMLLLLSGLAGLSGIAFSRSRKK